MRPMKPESPSLVLQFSPDDGVKKELAAVSEATSIPPRIIAAAVVRSCRGRFREITEEALGSGEIGSVLPYHVHQTVRPATAVPPPPPPATAPRRRRARNGRRRTG